MAYQYSADLSVHNLLSELTLHRAAISLLEAVAKKRGDENNVWSIETLFFTRLIWSSRGLLSSYATISVGSW